MDLRPLTDAALLARMEALVSQERENTGDVVEHLAEIDRREIALDRGYTTLFDYCVKKLRYSEAAAFLRIRAARAAGRFPRVLTDLRSGALNLDAIMRLYPHLSSDNSDGLLDRAAGASKREVLALVAGLGGTGEAPERDSIRHLPSRPDPMPPNAADAPGEVRGTTEVIAPPSRIRLAFTADDEFLSLVDRLRRLRRHRFPAGRLEDILTEAVRDFLGRIDPDRRKARRAGGAKAPAGVEKRSRWIPAAVKAQVWKRDGGRCAYVAADGRRCEGRDFLEYDHMIPWSLGGPSNQAGNIRLLCRPHNQRLARKRFGPRGSGFAAHSS